MSSSPKEVYVLGAGFTRAFADKAPLLVGDYDTDEVKKFDAFPYTHAILEQERGRRSDRKMDLERLMTRLAGGMPYDWKSGGEHLLKGLFSALKRSLLEKLGVAKADPNVSGDQLKQLAQHCHQNHIHCITFNYDDFLDKALWETRGTGQQLNWHPNWGYGFFCNSSVPAIGASKPAHQVPIMSMYLLKLHGSVNWWAKHGHPSPYTADAITHFEEWWTIPEYEGDLKKHQQFLPSVVKQYLDPEPFIVPPVLTKSDLVEQPVLRVIWSRAFDVLKEADKATFVGYSLPVTDIAASTLFRESLAHLKPSDVKVVDYVAGEDEHDKRRQVLENYGRVFPGITAEQIDLRGGLAWAEEVCRR
jgi:hypothetical protein